MNPQAYKSNMHADCTPDQAEGRKNREDDEQPESQFVDGPDEPNDRDLEF